MRTKDWTEESAARILQQKHFKIAFRKISKTCIGRKDNRLLAVVALKASIKEENQLQKSSIGGTADEISRQMKHTQ